LGQSVNWESVLWHEFCHVVTLQLTRNKMPRWLSEGISVYEELQVNPAWGQRMNPKYREMILGGELTPVSRLSGAFLSPKTEIHLQFAYFQAGMLVDHLVREFGMDRLKQVLSDLGEGIPINVALENNTIPMTKLEQGFEVFAREQAEAMAPELDWKKPDRGFLALTGVGAPEGPAVPELVESLSKNYYTLMERARRLVEEEKFNDAKAPLEALIKAYPTQTGGDCAYALLTAVFAGLRDEASERRVLTSWAAQDGEALPAFARLMELGEKSADWDVVRENAQRYLAVNPLVSLPYDSLAKASEKTGRMEAAAKALNSMLVLDPLDPAQVHYRLAVVLSASDKVRARRHVLQALEEAPRYRAALDLLLELQKAADPGRTTGITNPAGAAHPVAAAIGGVP
jgi:tetratricopeptide (TPR) repeat protein